MFGKRQKQTYVISSPMEGTLMKDGKPLANTKIIRHLWRNAREDEMLDQEFITDDHGRFSLPIYEEQLLLGRFTQFACTTHLEAEVEGQRFDVWFNDKFDPQIYGETEDRQYTDLICDLDNESVRVRLGVSTIETLCRWRDMPPKS